MNEFRYILRSRTGLYPFDLHHKIVPFGAVSVRQFWMEIATLYDARANGPMNAWSTVRYFWDLCRRHGTQGDRSVQESYLLARLLPFSRKAGTCRILADARERAHGFKARRAQLQAVRELDNLLAADPSAARTMRQFRDCTAAALGLPDVSDCVREKYQTFLAELLDVPCAMLPLDPEHAVALMRGRWDRAMRNWGRHGGRDDENKSVLDILSYECRTSYHRAYSALWSELMYDLHHVFHLSAEELAFIRIWHFDLFSASETPLAQFHLFHGHVFALHPAGALLAQSRSGQEIIGGYLAAATPEEKERPFQRLLYALEVAVHVYLARRDQTKQARKKQPLSVGPDGLAQAESALATRGRRRRRSAP
jgi:hypothetical protein